MIRRSTILSLLVAIGLGLGLFRLTYEVQTLEGDLSRLHRSITAEREAIHVLQAEWSYLNEPSRLEALTKKHLGLRATQDSRIRAFAEIPMRQPETAAVADAASTVPAAPAATIGGVRPTLAAGKPLP